MIIYRPRITPLYYWLGWKLELLAFIIALIGSIIGTIIICEWRGYY